MYAARQPEKASRWEWQQQEDIGQQKTNNRNPDQHGRHHPPQRLAAGKQGKIKHHRNPSIKHKPKPKFAKNKKRQPLYGPSTHPTRRHVRRISTTTAPTSTVTTIATAVAAASTEVRSKTAALQTPGPKTANS